MISRREFTAFLTGAGLIGMLPACRMPGTSKAIDSLSSTDRPLVLIHGAWHGGWCWKYVREAIAEHQPDRAILAPSLLGLADKAEALTPELSLRDQIDDIANLISESGLENIILVGHSFGGMIITALADRFGPRINHLVYLDAVVPSNGDSFITSGQNLSIEEEQERIKTFRKLAPDGIGMTPLPPHLFGIPKDHRLYSWVGDNLSPHPLKTCIDKLQISDSSNNSIPTAYIQCTNPPLQQPATAAGAKRAQSEKNWQFLELATGHDAMITAPQKLANILLSL